MDKRGFQKKRLPAVRKRPVKTGGEDAKAKVETGGEDAEAEVKTGGEVAKAGKKTSGKKAKAEPKEKKKSTQTKPKKPKTGGEDAEAEAKDSPEEEKTEKEKTEAQKPKTAMEEQRHKPIIEHVPHHRKKVGFGGVTVTPILSNATASEQKEASEEAENPFSEFDLSDDLDFQLTAYQSKSVFRH